MHCELRSADRVFFDGDASMVVARSPRGEFAIMNGHAPLLAVLDRGPVRIHTKDGVRVFACHPGTLRVSADRAALLVESAVPLEEIELSDVEARLAGLGEGGAADTERREHLALLHATRERYG